MGRPGRPRIPGRVARENLVTRSIITHTVEYRYVIRGGSEVKKGTTEVSGNAQHALRTVAQMVRGIGTLIETPVIIHSEKGLWGQTTEEFIKNGHRLDKPSSKTQVVYQDTDSTFIMEE